MWNPTLACRNHRFSFCSLYSKGHIPGLVCKSKTAVGQIIKAPKWGRRRATELVTMCQGVSIAVQIGWPQFRFSGNQDVFARHCSRRLFSKVKQIPTSALVCRYLSARLADAKAMSGAKMEDKFHFLKKLHLFPTCQALVSRFY